MSENLEEEFQGDSLWKMIENTPRPFVVIDYPRKDPIKAFNFGQIRMQLLSVEEQEYAAIRAHQHAVMDLKNKKTGEEVEEGAAYEDLYRQHLSLEIVQGASFSEEKFRDTGKLVIMFPPVKLMRMRMTDDELSYLMLAYLDLQRSKGAVRDITPDEDVETYAFMLVNQPEQVLTGLGYDGMVGLLMAFAKNIEDRMVSENGNA